MATARLALAQINPTVGDLEGNRRLIEQAIAAAREAGADLVALPELAITGYPPEDLVLRPSFVADNLRTLEALAPAATGITAIVGFVDRDGHRIFNAAAVISDGRVQAVYHKHLLPNYGVFDEKRYFTQGEGLVLADVASMRYGVTICEDLWSPDGPHVACAAAGAELIVNINGSPYHAGKGRERQALVATRARENRVAFAYVEYGRGPGRAGLRRAVLRCGRPGDAARPGAPVRRGPARLRRRDGHRGFQPDRPGDGVRTRASTPPWCWGSRTI